MNIDDKFMVFFFIMGMTLGFSACMIIGSEDVFDFFKKDYANQIPNTESEIVNNCKNLNLNETALCLRDNIETFYIYTSTDDEIANHMTFDEIKELGTDCGGFAYLYERLGKELGFESNTNSYAGLKDIYLGHRWTTVWDNETYCKLDMLKVNCWSINYE